MISALTNRIRQVPKSFYVFFIIGLLSFTVDYVLYIIFLGLSINMNLAKGTSSSIGVAVNYSLNSRYNFGGQNKMSAYHFGLYLCMYFVLILIHVLMNRAFFLAVGNEHVAVLMAISVSVFINYLCVKTFFSRTSIKI